MPMLLMDRCWLNRETRSSERGLLVSFARTRIRCRGHNTPSGTLDLPLALAEVYRRQGYTEESLRWFMQTMNVWVFKGHWASETSYADQAYKRLVELLMSCQ